jgi:hypothetical protein
MEHLLDLSRFLSPVDEMRARGTFEMLRGHDISGLVLTGGFAIELHLLRSGGTAESRPFNDIDFLVPSFDDIPTSLVRDLIFRHVHPNDPPGKTLLQAVYPAQAARLDIFNACPNTMARAASAEIFEAAIPMISLEDLTARMARLCLDLAAGKPVAAKHARDFLRLLPLVEHIPASRMDSVWQDHRKPQQPPSFAQVIRELNLLISARKDLLTVPAYSQNLEEICLRCTATAHFPLARVEHIHSLLGYC